MSKSNLFHNKLVSYYPTHTGCTEGKTLVTISSARSTFITFTHVGVRVFCPLTSAVRPYRTIEYLSIQLYINRELYSS